MKMNHKSIPISVTLQLLLAMETTKYCSRLFVFLAYISISSTTTFFTTTDARHVVQFSNFQGSEGSKIIINPESSSHRNLYVSETESSGLSTPFSMPPIESISPLSSPPNIPAPISSHPPFPPNFPFTSPPKVSSGPNSPLNPSSSHGISYPPHNGPIPSLLLPPPSPQKNPKNAVWCVAKPTVTDPIMQEAMDYACGSGADCKSIQPNGPCFHPNTLFSHASYAFNSYWQKTKLGGGGTCDFGGTAMLITVDPSFDDCDFIYN